jgi:hypothetical protein
MVFLMIRNAGHDVKRCGEPNDGIYEAHDNNTLGTRIYLPSGLRGRVVAVLALTDRLCLGGTYTGERFYEKEKSHMGSLLLPFP